MDNSWLVNVIVLHLKIMLVLQEHYKKRIPLYRVREIFQLFLTEYVDTNINLSLTSFNDLRSMNTLIHSHMPERSCLCIYHENMKLLLKPLSKYIRCPGLHSLQ